MILSLSLSLILVDMHRSDEKFAFHDMSVIEHDVNNRGSMILQHAHENVK